jgi:hypothetical protein
MGFRLYFRLDERRSSGQPGRRAAVFSQFGPDMVLGRFGP